MYYIVQKYSEKPKTDFVYHFVHVILIRYWKSKLQIIEFHSVLFIFKYWFHPTARSMPKLNLIFYPSAKRRLLLKFVLKNFGTNFARIDVLIGLSWCHYNFSCKKTSGWLNPIVFFLQILIYMNPSSVENAVNGNNGESSMWADLIASLFLLGHDLWFSSTIHEFKTSVRKFICLFNKVICVHLIMKFTAIIHYFATPSKSTGGKLCTLHHPEYFTGKL